MSPDPNEYYPDDLVTLSEPTWDALSNNYPLSADEARTLLWMFAGNITKAAKYYRMSSARLRAFVKKSPLIAADLHEMTERLLDLAEAVIIETMYSGIYDKQRYAAAMFVLERQGRGRGWGVANKFVRAEADERGRITVRWLE